MRIVLTLLLSLSFVGYSQTVYLRASAPQGQYITNATWTGTTYQITTAAPHGYSIGNTILVWNVCTTSQINSTVNGIRKVASVIDATDFTITTQSGANITNSGPWQVCDPAAYTGLLSSFTLGSGPFGPLDGVTGPSFRRLALSTSTGNVAQGLADTGSCPGDGICVSGGIITITTTYPHGVQVTSPGGQPEYFSIWGTSSTALNSNGTYFNPTYPGYKGASYAVTGATTYTWTANAPAGVTAGDYTSHPGCGSNGSTFDTINGTANCVVVSQLAYTETQAIMAATYVSGITASGSGTCNIELPNYWGGGNATGTIAVPITAGEAMTVTYPGYGYTVASGSTIGGGASSGTATCSNGAGGPLFTVTISETGDNPYWDNISSEDNHLGASDPIAYRHIFDGGVYPNNFSDYGSDFNSPALSFLVDQSNQQLLNVLVYNLDHFQRLGGVNFSINENYGGSGFTGGGFYAAWQTVAAWSFLSSTEKTTFLDKIYNDYADPMDATCSTTNVNVANNQLQIASGAAGTFASGTSGTSFQLGSGFPNSSIVNNVICFPENNCATTANGSYGVVATYNTGTGAGTVSSWSNGSPSSGSTYVVYQSGILSSNSNSTQQTTSTLTGGGASSVTLNIAVSTGNYGDMEIFFPASNQSAFITAYNTGTGVATLSPTLSPSVSSGALYSISSTAQVTGYNTAFTSKFTLGDGLNFYTQYDQDQESAMPGSMVVYIASNTSMYVLNADTTGSSSTPIPIWYYPQWASANTDCGLSWLEKFGGQEPIANIVSYPPSGGALSVAASEQGGNGATEFSMFPRMLMDFAAISLSSDQRAVMDLAAAEGATFDYYWQHYMNYSGAAHSANDYTWGTTLPGNWNTVWVLDNSMTGSSPAFPSLDQTGPWLTLDSTFKQYQLLPDWPSTGSLPNCVAGTPSATLLVWGVSGNSCLPRFVGWYGDGSFIFNPNGSATPYMRNWHENVLSWGLSYPTYFTLDLLQNLPTIGSSDYTVQPHQYLFQATDYATCASVTGWPCASSFGGFMAISREGWWDPNHTSHGGRTNSHLTVQFRSMTNDYDYPENGHYQLYKVGDLLGSDFAPPNSESSGGSGAYTIIGSMMQFGGTDASVLYGFENASSNATQFPTETPITEWSSANHGSWSTYYGDQNSQYMRVQGDLRGAYNQTSSSPYFSSYVTFNYCNRTVDELKPTVGDHFLVIWDACSTTSSQEIATHVHYPQNGETASAADVVYGEGNTTCPGTGGCSALNTSRWVQELESGTADGYAGDPVPNYGLITNYLSPGSIFVGWDGDTYSGSNGHTDRVTICAGSGSCNSAATSFESFTVHKVAGSLTDTSLTTSGITTADGNWYGAQMYGASSCAVVMEARGGVTRSSMSAFAPGSVSGVCAANVQYLFGGLTAGTYSVTVSGTPVTGSPFTVTANDNSIEFAGGSGTVRLNSGGSPSGPSSSSAVSGQVSVSGNVVIH